MNAGKENVRMDAVQICLAVSIVFVLLDLMCRLMALCAPIMMNARKLACVQTEFALIWMAVSNANVKVVLNYLQRVLHALVIIINYTINNYLQNILKTFLSIDFLLKIAIHFFLTTIYRY